MGLHSDIFFCRKKNAFLENDSAGGSLVSPVRLCTLGSLCEHSPSFTIKFDCVTLNLLSLGEHETLKAIFLFSPFVLSLWFYISSLFCKSPLSQLTISTVL